MKCPIDLLPMSKPSMEEFADKPTFFYSNVAKPLITDTIRLMDNGLPIDLQKVQELENELDTILEQVNTTIDNNAVIKEFLNYKYPLEKAALEKAINEKMRSPEYYLKPFKANNMIHRSYVTNAYFRHVVEIDLISPLEEISEGEPKWSVKDVKSYADKHSYLQRLISKSPPTDEDPIVQEGMLKYATDKAELWNRSYKDQIANITFDSIMEKFNPASSLQKRELFEFLNIEPIAFSKDTKEPSWGRDQIEELLRNETVPELQELYQAFIDHSFAAIVRNNFIKAFYEYTILHEDGVHRLQGTYRLLGAKTGRYTSNNPNMLNAPSSKSIYSKPIKRCFVAPPGFVVFGIDYAALEDKVIANLTNDKNKIITQTDQEIDGHLFHATIYFRKQFVDILGDLPHREITIAAKQALDAGDTRIKKLRDTSKNVTLTHKRLHTVMYVENYTNAGNSDH